MQQARDYDWLVTLMLLILVPVLGLSLSFLNVSTNTILWLIFAAIVLIGRAGLAGQATGLGRIINILKENQK